MADVLAAFFWVTGVCMYVGVAVVGRDRQGALWLRLWLRRQQRKLSTCESGARGWCSGDNGHADTDAWGFLRLGWAGLGWCGEMLA